MCAMGREEGALLTEQVVFMTTEEQAEALRAIKIEFGLSSRGAVVRECVDAGLAAVRARYARSTLVRRSADKI